MGESIHSPNAPTDDIPWPQVTFDVRLGRRLHSIGFDLEKYALYLHDAALTDQEIRETAVVFRSSHEPEYLAITPQGSYDYSERNISVKILWPIMASRVNKRLRHETSHRIDDCFDQRNTARTIIGNLAIVAGNVGIFGSIPAQIVSGMTGNAEISGDANIARWAGLGLLLTAASYRRWISPEERRAHKAESLREFSFITIQK